MCRFFADGSFLWDVHDPKSFFHIGRLFHKDSSLMDVHVPVSFLHIGFFFDFF